MYTILGGDGKQYGPVTAEALRQWVNEGRANRNTQIRPEGSEQWQSLASVPEFAPLFASSATGTNAAVGGTPVGPVPNSRMAVTSLVLGISGFCCPVLTALPGLILGIVAMNKIKASNGRLGGHGLALAGTITSGVALLFSIVLIGFYAALFLPALAKAKTKAQSINCMNNMKQLALGALLYSTDNNDAFPMATNWCDAIYPQVVAPKVFQCPGDASQARCGYAYNAALSGMASGDIAPDTVVFFESDAGWNGSGGKELLITQSRHYKTFAVAFADGHVEQVQEARLAQLRWNPTNNTNNPKE
jgi:prepilin-type processing-associated H-X9-DG protein